MIRRLFISALVALLVLPVTQATAGGKKKQQVEEGSVQVAAPYPPDEACFFGLHRRLQVFSQGAFPNGVVGYDFDVDPKTAGKNFVLEITDGAGDLDISFYQGLGSVDDGGAAPANFPYETRGEGGEAGSVPEGFEKVLICMYEGSNVSFEYRAGKGVKLPKE